jgi:hypothetical protein
MLEDDEEGEPGSLRGRGLVATLKPPENQSGGVFDAGEQVLGTRIVVPSGFSRR